jgi:hypothetical protein
MSFNTSNPVTLGRATRKSHYDTVFDNTIALKETRGLVQQLGGVYTDRIDDTTLVPIPAATLARIDGTNLSGFTVEVLFIGYVETGTGEVRLYNFTTSSFVSSLVTFTNTTAALFTISGITLTSGVNDYILYARGQTSAAQPTVYGARLVIR